MYKTFENNKSSSPSSSSHVPTYERPHISHSIHSFLAENGFLSKYIDSVGLGEKNVIDYNKICMFIGMQLLVSNMNRDCFFRVEDKTLIFPSDKGMVTKYKFFGSGASYEAFKDHMYEKYTLIAISEYICYLNGETLCSPREESEDFLGSKLVINSRIVNFLEKIFYVSRPGLAENKDLVN